MLSRLKRLGYVGRPAALPRRGLGLHVMPLSCGVSRETSPAYRWHGLRRGPGEFAIWQYTLSGRGGLTYEGKAHELTAGQAMLLTVPHDHEYFLPADSPHWEFVYLNLVGAEALRLWRDLLRRNGPVGTFAPDSATVDLATKLCADLLGGKLVSPFVASSRAYAWLMQVAEDLLPPGQSAPDAPPWLEKVADHCQAHLAEPLSVARLAAVAGCSRFHFTRLFAKAEGVAPWTFVRRLRLRHAVRLLQTERLGIKEVAARTGFHDPSYFCRAFRKEYGVSPQRYRCGENPAKAG
jgi:AraC-like DNA-binding protein